MENEEELCIKFLRNPSVYPNNPNKKLVYGKNPYNYFVNLCIII